MSEASIGVVREEKESRTRADEIARPAGPSYAPSQHPQLVCEPDIDDEAELRFVQTHGAGLFELGCALTRVGASAAGWSDTLF